MAQSSTVTTPSQAAAGRDHAPDDGHAGGCMALLPWVVLIFVATLYVGTVCPHAVKGDPAEFVTAAYTLGLSHPTGYPLYLVLGKAAMSLCFFVRPEIVLNGLSAVYCIAMLAVLIRCMQLLDLAPGPISLAVLMLALTPCVWENAGQAEVYTLHGLLFSVMLWLMISFDHAPSARKLVALALIAGLSIGNHVTTVLVYPGIALWLLSTWRRRPDLVTIRRVVTMAPAFVAGGAVVLLVFALDRADAYNYLTEVSIGQAPSLSGAWDRFIWTVTAVQFRGSSDGFGALFSVAFPTNVSRALAELTDSNALLLLFGSAGFMLLALRSPDGSVLLHMRGFFAVTLGLLVLYFSTYLKFFQPVFFICGWVILAITSAVLLTEVLQKRLAWWPWTLAVLMFMLLIAGQINGLRRSRMPEREQRAATLLASIESNAVIMSSWNDSTLLWFHQYVRRTNPTVDIINADPKQWARLADKFPGRPIYLDPTAADFDRTKHIPTAKFYKPPPLPY